MPGIRLEHFKKKNHNLRFILDLKGMSVQVQHFRSILKSLGDKYELLSDNCWSYSYHTVKNAIKLCKEAANLRPANKIKSSLEGGLFGQKKVKRIMPELQLSF